MQVVARCVVIAVALGEAALAQTPSALAPGAAALDAVREHKPDILLSDIEMPQMTGLDVAEAITREGLAPRVLIVTTFGRAGYLRRAMDAGVRGYLLKDTPTDALAAAIRKVAARLPQGGARLRRNWPNSPGMPPPTL